MAHTLDRNNIKETLKIVVENDVYDYDFLIRLTDTYKDIILENRIDKFSSVVIVSDPSIQFISTILACLETGVMFYISKSNDVERYLSHIDCDIVLVNENTIKQFSKSIKVMPSEPYEYQMTYRQRVLPETKSQGTLTTGLFTPPKNIVHSHKSIYLPSKYMEYTYYTSNDQVIIWDNFDDISYWTTVVYPSLFAGATLYLCHYSQEKMVDLLRGNKITILPTYHYKYEDIEQEWANPVLDNVRLVIMTGNILLRTQAQRILKNGVGKILNIYGLSEVVAPVSIKEITNENVNDHDKLDLGVVMPFAKIKSENGEIWASGTNVCQYNEDYKDWWNGEWYYTGDAGKYIDKNLYIDEPKDFWLRDKNGTETTSYKIVKLIRKELGEENFDFLHLVRINDILVLSGTGNFEKVQYRWNTNHINDLLRGNLKFSRNIDYVFWEKSIPFVGNRPEYSFIRRKYENWFNPR